MAELKLYFADCAGAPSNCSYPHEVVVTDAVILRQVVRRDYVCVAYKKGYRANSNFLTTTCLGMDCDNDHSENPEDWVTPEDVRRTFPDVTFAVHFSRNSMKEKRGKAPRPKFHVLFLIEEMTDPAEYSALKKRVNSIFPYFDTKALDAARFFFGTEEPDVEFHSGKITLNECLEMYYPEADEDAFWDMDINCSATIPEGSRNSTMSHFAGRVLKRYGDTEDAYNAFMERAAKCEPPLEDAELMTIWRSAQGFYQRVSAQDNYVPPEQWNAERSGRFTYDPDDRTDIGQARLLGKHFIQELRYSPATDYIRFDGACWQETKPGARAVVHALTDLQLEEAEKAVSEAIQKMTSSGAQEVLSENTRKKAEGMMSSEQAEAYRDFMAAEAYRAFVFKRRESKSMFDDVRAYPGDVHIIVSGTAASAATVLAMAADRLEMTPGSMWMIHDPSVFAFGNERDLNDAIRMLKACKESILNVYARRCHKNRDEVAAMMTETTWMDSHKAHTEGFVDGIVDMGSGIINAAYDRTVVLKDAQAKVSLWIERSRRRIEQCDKDTDALAPVAAAETAPASDSAANSTPEDPVTLPVDPGVPVAQLHKRLELIKPRH